MTLKQKQAISYLTILILLIVTIIFAILFGASAMTWNKLTAQELMILFNIRLPRIFAALICGAALCTSGALLQASLRNNIADPGIIGISSNANLFAIFASLIFPNIFGLRLVFAICGSLITFILLSLWQKRLPSDQLIIAGVALNAVFLALQNLISPNKSLAALSTSTWASLLLPAILILFTMIIAIYLMPWANYLKVSDTELQSLGQRPQLLRGSLLLLAIILAALSTVCVGVIAFIAIIIPHVARQLVGHDYRQVISFSILSGSWLLLFTDTIGRLIVLPNEIPANLILALIGGPFLIYLLTRKERQHD